MTRFRYFTKRLWDSCGASSVFSVWLIDWMVGYCWCCACCSSTLVAVSLSMVGVDYSLVLFKLKSWICVDWRWGCCWSNTLRLREKGSKLQFTSRDEVWVTFLPCSLQFLVFCLLVWAWLLTYVSCISPSYDFNLDIEFFKLSVSMALSLLDSLVGSTKAILACSWLLAKSWPLTSK